jgi:hypothetical protein
MYYTHNHGASITYFVHSVDIIRICVGSRRARVTKKAVDTPQHYFLKHQNFFKILPNLRTISIN